MARLIDEDYFIRDISLPNLNKEISIGALNNDIDKYQKQVLIKLLGYNLYSEFIANPDSSPRFKDIRDGKVFIFDFNGNTVTRKWIGLANIELDSLIAYYTYYFHARNKVSFTGGIGETSPKSENAIRANAEYKLTSAWNNYVNQAGRPLFLSFNKFDLSSYEHADDSGSLFNFLLANAVNYPEWEFEPDFKINIYGI